ncbi:DUF4861 family protein [candidate division KSB1 bacterium]|nr:DUF4861 family protein [candidate division KSB1 bacterium]
MVKRKKAWLCVAVLWLFVQCATKPSAVVTIINPSNLNRMGEVVELNWQELTKTVTGLRAENVMVFREGEETPLVSQIFDKNLDGVPDQFLFMADVRAGDTSRYVIRNEYKLPSQDTAFVYGAIKMPREDYAWENDRIAFRVYGPPLAADVNNGIDVWCKRVPQLIIDKWYALDEKPEDQGRQSYHEDHGEGADFFSVGTSLGCGGSAIFDNVTLIQPDVFKKAKLIANGPLRVSCELTYAPVSVGDNSITEVKRITLDVGSNLNKIESVFSAEGSNDSLEVAVGLVKRTGTTYQSNWDNAWISLWGEVNDVPDNGELGTVAMMSPKKFKEFREDKQHHLIIGTATLNQPFIYYVGAGWTGNGFFVDDDSWIAYIKEFVIKMDKPLVIKIGR